MLLTDARRPARVDAGGDIVPLDAQDRSRWDRGLVAEGTAILERAWNRRAIGEYQLQAAIAAVHDRAARAEETDWREILGLYTLLERVAPSPMTSLNRAVAAAMVDGPEAGLDIVEGLEPELGDHHRLHAVRAHLLERDGRGAEAAGSYGKAARLARNLPEQRYLLAQAARLAE
jgi:predicted RNA polymerase sigma factor